MRINVHFFWTGGVACRTLVGVMKTLWIARLAATMMVGLVVGGAGHLSAQTGLDYGDHRSETLMTKAWNAFNAGSFLDASGYASKCIELYKQKALEQQASLSEPVPSADKEAVFSMWALNDVGAALFVRGQAAEKTGNAAGAKEDYTFLKESLPFAQCWDPQGWFWKPADAAAGRLKVLEYEALQ